MENKEFLQINEQVVKKAEEKFSRGGYRNFVRVCVRGDKAHGRGEKWKITGEDGNWQWQRTTGSELHSCPRVCQENYHCLSVRGGGDGRDRGLQKVAKVWSD